MALNAVDPREYLNDAEEGARLAQEGHQSRIWTAMPAIIQSVDLTKMVCVAIPAIQGRFVDPSGEIHFVDMPKCLNVPICFPSSSGFMISLPLAIGDEVLLVFASRCIDSWWVSGGYSNVPIEYRMHDLSDGFAMPGPKSLLNTFPSISSTDLQIRNKLGTTFLSIGMDGKIGFANATGSLKASLTALNTTLSTFMTVLAAFSGGGSPTTQAMLQVPAAAAVTGLTTFLADIGALLK